MLEGIELLTAGAELELLYMGARKGELRLFFSASDSRDPEYVLELRDVHKYLAGPILPGRKVCLSYNKPPGSFGWDLAEISEFVEVRLKDSKDSSGRRHAGRFHALAREARLRTYVGSEDLNFPG